jgi:hypothetical protein
MAPPSTRVGTVALTCVPAFMVALDNLVVVTALAAIRRDLGVSVEQLSWTVERLRAQLRGADAPRGGAR